MCEDFAIKIQKINKSYKLYPSIANQAVDVFGLSKIFFWVNKQVKEHHALIDFSLNVKRGERIGIVGRNGAGKSTLLKLITGNFAPNSGEIIINGKVQALMHVGLGFHPEFSGLENIKSSLIYNGIQEDLLPSAIEEVCEFVELDEYLHQPMKTYSLGMQARLMFAAATAITPDILIIDEVLGAGDSYFGAKSALRMEKLTKSGCSLLLVSHSTQQILQFCERVIWIENGRIVMDGKSLPVVRAYEEYTQKLTSEAKTRSKGKVNKNAGKSILHDKELREKLLESILGVSYDTDDLEIPNHGILSGKRISRWKGVDGLKIKRVSVKDKNKKESSNFITGDLISIEVEFEAMESGEYPCIFVILLFSNDGRWVTRHFSKNKIFKLRKGEKKCVSLEYETLLLGAGSYTFSAAIYKELDIENLSTSKFYDLLSRSFKFDVTSKIPDDQSLLHHPSIWLLDK